MDSKVVKSFEAADVGFAACISAAPAAAQGRRRVYAMTISMPQTCRSNWHVTRPTIGPDTSGQGQPVATDSFLASQVSVVALKATGALAVI
jgi:hypothetical protein